MIETIDRMLNACVDYMCRQVDDGLDNARSSEMMALADIIKDLSEAEEKLEKAKYYSAVVHAMESGEKISDGYRNTPAEMRYGGTMPDTVGQHDSASGRAALIESVRALLNSPDPTVRTSMRNELLGALNSQ